MAGDRRPFLFLLRPLVHAVTVGRHDRVDGALAGGNVMGTQFHPEKSGADGLRVYKNFVALCS